MTANQRSRVDGMKAWSPVQGQASVDALASEHPYLHASAVPRNEPKADCLHDTVAVFAAFCLARLSCLLLTQVQVESRSGSPYGQASAGHSRMCLQWARRKSLDLNHTSCDAAMCVAEAIQSPEYYIYILRDSAGKGKTG
jgi:hypothetical protein